MARRIVPAVLLAVTLALPGVASAVTVASGPDGRALLTWSVEPGMRLAERTPDGTITSPRTIVTTPEVFDMVSAWGPGGEAIVVAYDQSIESARKILVLRRTAGAQAFGPPVTIAQAAIIEPLGAVSSVRGDIAVLVRLDEARTVLLTAARGGQFGPPQAVDVQTEFVALGVGGSGRVALAGFDHKGKFALRSGQAGSPIGAAQRLEAAHVGDELAVAVDDAGNATFAARGSRRVKGADQASSRAQADLRSTVVVTRARPGARFGVPRTVAVGGTRDLTFVSLRLAAAGTTTALAWKPVGVLTGADGRIHVAIAHGAGAFGTPQSPSVAPFGQFTFNAGLLDPSIAVDRTGDVLLAYDYGYAGHAVHVTRRRAGRSRFDAPRVVSALGLGGEPVAALLSDRTPLVAYTDTTGALHARTRLDGRHPDLSAPRATVTLQPDAEAQLRATNAIGVKIRCSEPCIVQAHATLRTKTGRAFDGQEQLLRRGAMSSTRFAFDPATRAGRARDGSRLRVTVTVENSSGSSREMVRQLTIGA